MNRLSLCMIVKNEQEMLPDCLASVRGIVDEMIVVDTGSTDETKAIAVAAGAKVVDFPWCDDFAAARNAALPHVSSEWILVLDADERLVASEAHLIRRAIQDPSLDLGLLPLHSANRLDATHAEILSGEARRGEAVLLPRLLRRTPDLFWTGVVHENVVHWISKRVERCRGIPAAIVHLGAVPSIREARAKSERNIQLLLRRAKLEPGNPLPYTFLSQEYANIQRLEEAEQAIGKAWYLLSLIAPKQNPKPQIVDTATLMAHHCIERSDAEGALSVLRSAFEWGANHPNLWFMLGLAHQQRAQNTLPPAERRREYVQAIEAFRKCISMDGRAFPEEMISGITGPVSWYYIGYLLLQLGELDDADAVFASAIPLFPRDRRLLIGRALVQIERTEPVLALQAMEPLMQQGVPDAWVIAAAATEGLGKYEDAAFFLQQARGTFLVPSCQLLATTVERTLSLYQGRAIGGLEIAGRLNALITRKALPRGYETSYASFSGRVSRTVTTLLLRGEGKAIEALLEPRAEQMLPGVHELVKKTLATYGIVPEEDTEPELLVLHGKHADPLANALEHHPRLVRVSEATGDPRFLQDPRTQRIPIASSQITGILSVGKRGRALIISALAPDLWRQAFPSCRVISTEPSSDSMVLTLASDALRRPEQTLRDILAFAGEAWTDNVLGYLSETANHQASKVLNSPLSPPNRSAPAHAGGFQ